MIQKKRISSTIAATAVLALAVSGAVPAAYAADDNAKSADSMKKAESIHVRGKIESLDGSTLTVDGREGKTVTVMLDDGFKIAGIAKASADDIKEGDFVGIASLPDDNGKAGAVEVLIFPAAMKGTGEGSYPWDLEPNSTMTNATVSNMVTKADGRSVTLKYNGGEEKTIAIPADTPIVTFAKAARDDLKAGATVFVPGQKSADGTISTGTVVVGNNGVVPPM